LDGRKKEKKREEERKANYGKLRIEGFGIKRNPSDGYCDLIRAVELGFGRALELLAQF
jgi:hypothetical protein